MDQYFATGDVFDAEEERLPENVVAEKQRREYSAKICEIQWQPDDSVGQGDFSYKQTADLAYKNKNFNLAIEMYEKFLRSQIL